MTMLKSAAIAGGLVEAGFAETVEHGEALLRNHFAVEHPIDDFGSWDCAVDASTASRLKDTVGSYRQITWAEFFNFFR